MTMFKEPTLAERLALIMKYDVPSGYGHYFAAAVEAYAAELDMMYGQRMVLFDLLSEAADVIHNLPDVAETQEEADMLNTLKDRIADARGAVLLELAARKRARKA